MSRNRICPQERLNIAVFIDFDNIEIGVKSTLGEQFDVGTILDAIKERGEVVTKIAYADWTRAGEYSRALTQHAIRLVQRNLTPGGDKNGADINLALDALEMAFTHPHINAYVIVGGDSDFLSLVEKLKQYDKKVFVVGGRAFTSVILQRNCHEFIAYENLHGGRKPAAQRRPPAPAAAASSPIAQAFPIVRRALKILADREVSPQTGLLKSTLLQLDSTFSERNYGASSFLDFVEKLSQAGLVQLKHAGRSVMVELNESFEETAGKNPPSTDGPMSEETAPEEMATSASHPTHPASPAHSPHPAHPAAPALPQVGTQADAVRMVAEILRNASGARWPMYLRNVKQILRQYRDGHTVGNGAGPGETSGFDERRYGFGGLIDLLRACQREGLVTARARSPRRAAGIPGRRPAASGLAGERGAAGCLRSDRDRARRGRRERGGGRSGNRRLRADADRRSDRRAPRDGEPQARRTHAESRRAVVGSAEKSGAARQKSGRQASRAQQESRGRGHIRRVVERLRSTDASRYLTLALFFVVEKVGPLLDERGLWTAFFLVCVRVGVRELQVLRPRVDEAAGGVDVVQPLDA